MDTFLCLGTIEILVAIQECSKANCCSSSANRHFQSMPRTVVELDQSMLRRTAHQVKTFVKCNHGIHFSVELQCKELATTNIVIEEKK